MGNKNYGALHSIETNPGNDRSLESINQFHCILHRRTQVSKRSPTSKWPAPCKGNASGIFYEKLWNRDRGFMSSRSPSPFYEYHWNHWLKYEVIIPFKSSGTMKWSIALIEVRKTEAYTDVIPFFPTEIKRIGSEDKERKIDLLTVVSFCLRFPQNISWETQFRLL